MDEFEANDEENSGKFRVKIYEMTEAGNWNDRGTGHVSCLFNNNAGYSLAVQSDEDGSYTLNSKILVEGYTVQQDTLILWHDASGVDLALSFQEHLGCLDIWNQIKEIQKRIATESRDIDHLENGSSSMDQDQAPGPTELTLELEKDFCLPEPAISSLENLELIFLVAVKSMFHRENLLKQVLETEFLEKFFGLLEQCEDLEMLDECFRLSSIVKCIFYLNNPGLYTILLQDPYFMVLLGMLEYDREYPTAKSYYREYFEKHVNFKEVVPIQNPELVLQIQRVYRAQYIKEVALSRTIEDSTLSALNTLIFHNQTEILTTMESQKDYLGQIISMISDNSDPKKKKEAVDFLLELCSIAKPFGKEAQAPIFNALGERGLLLIIGQDLGILTTVLEQNTASVRRIVVAEKEEEKKERLLTPLIHRLSAPLTDDGVRLQILECFRLLLDTSPSPGTIWSAVGLSAVPNPELELFLTFFYDDYADFLFNVLSNPAGHGSDLIGNLLDILSFFITQNGMSCKNYLLQGSLVRDVAQFFDHTSAFVKLAALRVFRTCLGQKDEFYRRLLIKQQIFEKIVGLLTGTAGKNNLLNSACLEFFDYIQKEDGMKSVIVHIVSMHRKKFIEDLSYAPNIFSGLIAKFDDYENDEPKDCFDKTDNTQEAYFDSADLGDAPEVVPPSSTGLEFVSAGLLKPLVPYSLDEEEEDDFLDKIASKTAHVPDRVDLQNGKKPKIAIKIGSGESISAPYKKRKKSL